MLGIARRLPLTLATVTLPTVTFATVTFATALGPGPAIAQDYPSRPIQLVVPYGPGGTSDLLARIISEHLPRSIGQPVVVENRAGAGGAIGTAFVARARPDGHTLLQAFTPEIAIVPGLMRKPTYDALKDLAPVLQVAEYPLVLVTQPAFPARSLGELIELARSKPGQVSYASSGNGSPAHLAFELIEKRAGIDMVHVSYKGAGPALADVLAGHVSAFFSSIAAAMPHLRSGQLRALAVSSGRRAVAAPDIPTVAESGLDGYDISTWNGVFVPAGTPAAIIAKLNAAITDVFELPEVRDRLTREGAVFRRNSAAAFATFVEGEVGKYQKIITDAGLERE